MEDGLPMVPVELLLRPKLWKSWTLSLVYLIHLTNALKMDKQDMCGQNVPWCVTGDLCGKPNSDYQMSSIVNIGILATVKQQHLSCPYMSSACSRPQLAVLSYFQPLLLIARGNA